MQLRSVSIRIYNRPFRQIYSQNKLGTHKFLEDLKFSWIRIFFSSPGTKSENANHHQLISSQPSRVGPSTGRSLHAFHAYWGSS